jgi:FkbM family methyltransferase
MFFNFAAAIRPMKNSIQYLLQCLLGFKNYLFVFAIYIIYTLRWNNKEGDFLKFLSLIPSKNGILLDIGANIGVMTYYMARRFPDSTIYAFEPMPVNIITIHKILKFFKLHNVKVIEKALGDEDKNIEMLIPVVHKAKKQGLVHVVHESMKDFNEGEKFKTIQIRLDSIRDFDTKPVTGIKLDVENYEYFVLKGGQHLISKHRPVIYAELWDNENRKQCFDLLTNEGYAIKVLVNKNLVNFDPVIHQKQNFFFLP